MVSAMRNFPANVTLRKDGTQWMEHAPSDGFGNAVEDTVDRPENHMASQEQSWARVD